MACPAAAATGAVLGEYVIIIHPSARDWKLFMYENNDVRRKENYFKHTTRSRLEVRSVSVRFEMRLK